MDDAPPPAATLDPHGLFHGDAGAHAALPAYDPDRVVIVGHRTLVIEDPIVLRVPLGDDPSFVIGVPATFTPDDAEALVALLRDQQAAERHCATCDCG